MNTTKIGKTDPGALPMGRPKKAPVDRPMFKCPDVIEWTPGLDQRGFIAERITAGKFKTPEDLISIAIFRMMSRSKPRS